MDQAAINSVLQPKPSKQEAKADTTSRVARQIIDAEVARREAKTDKLRAARLARAAAEEATNPRPAKDSGRAPRKGK